MRPESEAALSEMIKAAQGPLHIRGGGTRDIGRPVVGEVLETSALSGITLYEPGALTLVAQAGTLVDAYGARSDFNSQTLAVLREVSAAARAVAQLARTIERNPNSLLIGR